MQVKSMNEFSRCEHIYKMSLFVDIVEVKKESKNLYMQIGLGISRTYVLQTHILVYRFIWIDCSHKQIDEYIGWIGRYRRMPAKYLSNRLYMYVCWCLLIDRGTNMNLRKIRRNASFFYDHSESYPSKLIAVHS